MIKLEDVSTNDLYMMALLNSKFDYSNLCKFNILNYQQLTDLINSGNFIFESKLLEEYFLRINRTIEKANLLGRNPEIYLLDNYSVFGYSKEIIDLLKKQDSKVMGNELMFANPLGGVCVTNTKLSKMNIEYIKYLLEHCVVIKTNYIGKNALANERGFGVIAVSKVLKSIKFYEEQVIRQLKENNDIVCDNLFYKNYDEKVLMVLDNLWEIVRYFVDNAHECVWGNMTEYQKNELMDTLSKYYDNPIERPIISRFVNCIANYTTVSELEKGLIKTKTLDRFIIK